MSLRSTFPRDLRVEWCRVGKEGDPQRYLEPEGREVDLVALGDMPACPVPCLHCHFTILSVEALVSDPWPRTIEGRRCSGPLW